ncbi:hypothetical protein HDK77DRAFT_151771 [Phyllosticta capitalensis]
MTRLACTGPGARLGFAWRRLGPFAREPVKTCSRIAWRRLAHASSPWLHGGGGWHEGEKGTSERPREADGRCHGHAVDCTRKRAARNPPTQRLTHGMLPWACRSSLPHRVCMGSEWPSPPLRAANLLKRNPCCPRLLRLSPKGCDDAAGARRNPPCPPSDDVQRTAAASKQPCAMRPAQNIQKGVLCLSIAFATTTTTTTTNSPPFVRWIGHWL